MGFTCKWSPSGSSGCCRGGCRSVEVNTESRLPKAESFSRGSPSLEAAPSPRLSPQAEREREGEGCLHALPGGWTDGKELAR